MSIVNYYMIAKDRKVKLEATTVAKARREVREKYPDAIEIERETIARKSVRFRR